MLLIVSMMMSHLGVKITAFGWKIVLFACHPGFQLECHVFCVFRIDRIYL